MLCTVNDVAPLLVEKQGLVDIPVKYVKPKYADTPRKSPHESPTNLSASHQHHNRDPRSMFANMPRRSSKAIVQHSLIHAMEFTALRILLWDYDDEDSDLDVEFLEDLYACWSGLKSQRYMAPREHGSAGRHTGTHVLNNPIY